MNTLLIRLGAPLQSWGSDSKYDIRRTDRMPTKSGVIGLLAAALGRTREESIEDLALLRFGVRIENPGTIINDFQVTEMKNEKGKGLKSNISNRQYISDGVFLAGLESEDSKFLHELSYAVTHPVYPLYLGTRSCPPTLPVLIGVREGNLEEVLYNEPCLVSESMKKRAIIALRIIVESKEKSFAVKRDVPISFSSYNRQYHYRYMKEMPSKVIQNKTDSFVFETNHDPMKEL